MKRMWATTAGITLGAVTATAAVALAMVLRTPPALVEVPAAPPRGKALIEVAVLLDTSGSMQGLIHQARTKLWSMINRLASAERDGTVPHLRVALYEFGRGTLSPDKGFMRQILPLTEDLDRISSEMFTLNTGGSNEYFGQVIQQAVDELVWSEGGHFKTIFIAGNEPFNQGPVDFTKACAAALARGIVVNTIHCGNEREAISGMWKTAAHLAGGQAMNIDQDAASVAIATPVDGRIEELSRRLNETYIAYGARAAEGKSRQVAQDANARQGAAGGVADRAYFKTCEQYSNDWDLVDAIKDDGAKLGQIGEADLPQEVRSLAVEAREAYVLKKASDRAVIQAEIRTLSAERDRYVASEQTKNAPGAVTFDLAVNNVLAKQLEEHGYAVKK